MPNYEIVDFYYNKLDDDKFKSRENLKQWIIDNYDSQGTAKLWMEHNDWHENVSPTGKTIGGKVDDINSDYIKKINEDIEKANTETELGKINIDASYEEDTQNIIKGQIGEKLEIISEEKPITVEIEGVEYEIPAKFERGRPRAMVSEEVRATAGEIMGEIADAGTDNDLDKLRGIEIRNLPGQLRRMLERELRETISAVEEELEEKEKT